MWKTIALILPVVIPSWRFFSSVKPSPRVQFTLLKVQEGTPKDWQEFRPRPKVVTPFQMVCRLLWNPDWNEALFLVSCAERMLGNPTQHSIDEIRRRILFEVDKMPIERTEKWMQFRLVFVHRSGCGLSEQVVFLSRTYSAISGESR